MITSLLAAMAIGFSDPAEQMAMIPGRTNGYLVLPAKVVCDGEIKSLNWSQDSQYLVAIRSQITITKQMAKRMVGMLKNPNQPPPAANIDPVKNSVVVWNSTESKVQTVWAGRSSLDSCEQVALVGSTLYLMIRQATAPIGSQEGISIQASLYRCQLGTASLQLVRAFEIGTHFQIAAADPVSKSILLTGFGLDGKQTEALVTSGGITSVADSSQMPKGILEGLSRRPTPWVGGASEPVAPSEEWRIADDKNKELTLQTKKYSPAAKEVKTMVRSLVCDDPAKPGKAYQVIANGVGERFALSDNNSSLAYTIDNVLVVRDLVPAPIELIRQAKEAAERAQTMSNAKQVGLAMIMFAADNDDEIPGGLSTDQLIPYIKNADMMNGFVFSWGGGNVSKIENPAETELGYVTGQGGRAIIYADGHVKWKAD